MGCIVSTRTPTMTTKGNFNDNWMNCDERIEDFPLRTIKEEFSELEQSQNSSYRNSVIKTVD